MNLVALPAFTDNYIWMLHDGHQALVVDPGDSVPVVEALNRLGLRLTGILVTHHHADHVGGLAALHSRLEGPIWGPAGEAIGVDCVRMAGGQHLSWAGLEFSVLDVPGHTAGHVAYFLPAHDAETPVLFCGDTLFSGGCGRLFEGTPSQMYHSLQSLAALPGSTRVCCAHEYTLSNLRFALAVEPGNQALQRYAEHCTALRARSLPTLPATLATELQINPFLRCDQAVVIRAAQQRDPLVAAPDAVLGCLRQWKNQYQ
jgi:hydroxyacylglutathione hydrolase